MFGLSPEHLTFRDSVRRMVARHVAPIAAEIDETGRFPEELVPIFGDLGLLQFWVPEAFDGPGGDLTALCLARQEVARASLACSLMVGQNAIGLVLPLLHAGTQEQRARWLPLSAAGRLITACAITEAGGGSDVAGMKTTARRAGDEWIIDGRKSWITFASVAKLCLVFAKTGGAGSRRHDDISAFLVETDTAGFRIERHERLMGLHGAPNCEISLEGVRVPDAHRIGEVGQGFLECMRIMDINRPANAASALGLAIGAFEVARDYVKERSAFGRKVADFQSVQHMLADMAMGIASVRALLYQTTLAYDAGEVANLSTAASMCKCLAGDLAMRVSTDAVQLMGAAGYARDGQVERMMRDAKLTQIFEGTNQIQRNVIARDLLRA